METAIFTVDHHIIRGQENSVGSRKDHSCSCSENIKSRIFLINLLNLIKMINVGIIVTNQLATCTCMLKSSCYTSVSVDRGGK